MKRPIVDVELLAMQVLGVSLPRETWECAGNGSAQRVR
jgi:hypothetical protein